MSDSVSEVEEPDGQSAQDDGKVEPAQEGSFVGEKDFRLYARGEGDAFAYVVVSGLDFGVVCGIWYREL